MDTGCWSGAPDQDEEEMAFCAFMQNSLLFVMLDENLGWTGVERAMVRMMWDGTPSSVPTCTDRDAD